MISGVRLTPLKQIPDERGRVMHLMRSDWDVFESFGEAYFSVVNPGVVKGWHLHERCTLNYTAVHGMVKVALYDERQDSPTCGEVNEFFLGVHNYQLITIPPGIWNGVKGISVEETIIAICLNMPYDPGEIRRVDPFCNHIPYSWDVKHG